jgi:Ca2+-binding RTX toxin-like protein
MAILQGDRGDNSLAGSSSTDTLTGEAGNDTLSGGDGFDRLDGGDGADRLLPGSGGNELVGGEGVDLFEFTGATFGPANHGRAIIEDFTRDDLLLFRGVGAATAATYVELTSDLTDTSALARDQFARGYEYVAIQASGGVTVYTPRTGEAVVLHGATLDTLSTANFVSDDFLAPFARQGTTGADTMYGDDGADTLSGSGGNDSIDGRNGTSYLRGDDGDDRIVGGAGFDDINGNMGNDTGSGGLGDDWVVGGKDNDSLSGGAGNDLVYGNIGNDTCEGGDGADIVRGGQNVDLVSGGAGNDYLSGDKGDDTMTGGAGADVFHSFGDAGLDIVTDFNGAEGDRILLDPGTQYTLEQVGGQAVINVAGGAQMVLQGVTLASLASGWITVG